MKKNAVNDGVNKFCLNLNLFGSFFSKLQHEIGETILFRLP